MSKIILFFYRSVYGANFCAVSAIDASVSVDLVLVSTLRNSVYGALGSTSTARNASVSNLESHNNCPP